MAARRALSRPRSMMFGSRPLCTVLRPRFLTRDAVPPDPARGGRDRPGASRGRTKRRWPTPTAGAVPADRLGDDAARRSTRATACPSPLGRFDSFFVGRRGRAEVHRVQRRDAGRAGYVTCSASSSWPAGDASSSGSSTTCARCPAGPSVLQTLLECYHAATGRRDMPRIAILDWHEVPTHSEFDVFKDYFESMGIDAASSSIRGSWSTAAASCGRRHRDRPDLQAGADPRADRARGDGPPGGAGRARPGGVHGEPVPLQGAPQEGEPRGAERRAQRGLFTPRCSRRSPSTSRGPGWWRSGRPTLAAARTSTCSTMRRGNARQLVLKPNDDYGGNGIVLGWTVDDADLGARRCKAALARRRTSCSEREFGLPTRSCSQRRGTAPYGSSTACSTPSRYVALRSHHGDGVSSTRQSSIDGAVVRRDRRRRQHRADVRDRAEVDERQSQPQHVHVSRIRASCRVKDSRAISSSPSSTISSVRICVHLC